MHNAPISAGISSSRSSPSALLSLSLSLGPSVSYDPFRPLGRSTPPSIARKQGSGIPGTKPRKCWHQLRWRSSIRFPPSSRRGCQRVRRTIKAQGRRMRRCSNLAGMRKSSVCAPPSTCGRACAFHRADEGVTLIARSTGRRARVSLGFIAVCILKLTGNSRESIEDFGREISYFTYRHRASLLTNDALRTRGHASTIVK